MLLSSSFGRKDFPPLQNLFIGAACNVKRWLWVLAESKISSKIYLLFFRQAPTLFLGTPAELKFSHLTTSVLGSQDVMARVYLRLGTRQKGETAWNDSDGSIGSAVALLRSKAQAWKIAAGRIETSAVHVQEIIAYILQNHSGHLEGVLRAVYNGLELRVDIIYQGSRTGRLPTSRNAYAPIDNDLENEEAAAYIGLRNFLRSLAVDRQQVKMRNNRVIVRLYYEV